MRTSLATWFVLACSLPALAGDIATEIDGRREQARASAEAGDQAAAREALLLALELSPSSPEVLGDLLRLAADDPDETLVWALRLARRTSGPRGRVKVPSGASASSKVALKTATTLAKRRADALGALVKLAKPLDSPGDAALARRILRIGRELAQGSADVTVAQLAPLDDAVYRCGVDRDAVAERLRRATAVQLEKGALDEAFAGARALRGLCVQQRRSSHSVTPVEQDALSTLDRVRAARWDSETPHLTVDDLRAVAVAQRATWSAAHSTWDSPALVVSPNGLYRIESVCGLRSTAMVAVDVELVHRRLARWFGSDPFEDRVGTIRLVDGDAGIEGEGMTLLWARAFNAGEVTISPVRLTTRRWLSRGFSHELTHRFDADLYGALPGWLREGRANYAQVTSTVATAEALDPRAVDFSMLANAQRAGYRDESALADLLRGRPVRPQDDYDVGYSLWLYFVKRRPEAYADRLVPYLVSHREKPGMDPVTRFASFLADGKNGRADGVAKFAVEFGEFLDDAVGRVPAPWRAEWTTENIAATQDAEALRSAPLGDAIEFTSAADQELFDRTNSIPRRKRYAAPELGEVHAFTAARFLAAIGDIDGATQAFEWSRAVDEPTRDQLRTIVDFHSAAGNDAAAWAEALVLAEFHGEHPLEGTSAPKKLIRGIEPLVTALHALAQSSDESAPRAAAMLRAEAHALELATGTRPEGSSPAGAPEPDPGEGLVAAGIVDVMWAPANASAGSAWAERSPDDLILGTTTAGPRSEPSSAPAEAGARQPVFVRTVETYGPAFTLRTQVRPRSARTKIAVVLGVTRADRGTLVEITSGPSTAWGVEPSPNDLAVRIDDFRDADWGVCEQSATTKTQTPSLEYELAVHVIGASVRIEIDGSDVLSFRTATGLPLTGRIGFLLTEGLVELRRPRVERLSGNPTFAMRLDALTSAPRASWAGREIDGLPLDAKGTLLLIDPGAVTDAEHVRSTLARATELIGPADHRERVRVAVPADAAKAIAAWEAVVPGRVHTYGTEAIVDASPAPLYCAIDARGVIRSTGVWAPNDRQLHRLRTLLHRLRGW